MRNFTLKPHISLLAFVVVIALVVPACAANPGSFNDTKSTAPKSSSTGKSATQSTKTGSSTNKTHTAAKTPSRTKYDSVTVNRGVTTDSKMKNWGPKGANVGGSNNTGSNGSKTKSKTDVSSFNMGKQAPYDQNSGQASGKRQHSPTTTGTSSGSSTSKTNIKPTNHMPTVREPVHKINETPPPATKTPASDHKQ